MSVLYRGKKFKVKKVKGSGLHLNLNRKKIVDISQVIGLEELSDLIFLDLSENQITEISGLSNLKNLRTLLLSGNQITEIKGLDNLINLENLTLVRNQITKINGLNNLENLKRLELSFNNISELHGLEYLKNLEILLLFNNPVFGWIKENLGSFRLAKVAVKFCARKKGTELFNLEEVEKILALKEQQIMTAVHEKEYHNVMKILRDVHNEVKLDESTLFYKFLGEFLWKFPKLFEKKKFMNEYMAEIDYIVNKKQGFQLEVYVINNYCTYENEEVLSSFYGKIDSHNMEYEGRIHITNFRIFLFGKKDDTNKPIFLPFGGLIVGIVRDAMRAEGKRMMSKYGRGEDIPGFGYQFPLINVNKIYEGDKNFKVWCYVGSNTFKMKISPKQLKGENEKELSERIEYITSLIPLS